VVLGGDELDHRRVVHALDRAGFLVGEVGAGSTPDVVISLGDVARRPTTRGAGSRLAGAPHVLVLVDGDRASIDRALAAGAVGVVRESDIDDRLAATVHAAAVGQLCIPSDHAGAARPMLSPREKQVMSMVVLGFTNQEIANKLHVTETTVKSHLSSAYRKLNVRSRHEATAVILADQAKGLGILTLAGDRTSVRDVG
jgi:DNA-binding NarL/FixJ family response regulator